MSIKMKFYVFWKKATDQIAPGSRSNSWKIFQMCQNQRHLFILQKIWLHWSINKLIPVSIVLIFFPSRNHPFKMSAFFRGEGSKIGQICRQIVVKNCRREGVGVKNRENGWSLNQSIYALYVFMHFLEIIFSITILQVLTT